MGLGRKSAEKQPPAPPPSPPSATDQLWKAVGERDAASALRLAPAAYAVWWATLLKEDPWHVVVETMLLVFIIYLVFRKKPKKLSELTEQDVNDLVRDWKPAPLVPALSEADNKLLKRGLVIDAFAGSNELVLSSEAGHNANHKKPGSKALNLLTHDFLGLAGRPELKAAAQDTLDVYGCGSCGPRGFYGTVMPHLRIESEVAAFMGCESAIAYSDTASCLASTIPAFAKKGDLVVVDAGVKEALKVGVDLSRSKVYYYKHNDLADLELVLKKIAKDVARLGRDVTKQRRFIVTEALFQCDGSLCPLEGVVALKKQFGYRLILDETQSFGTVGATGRGLTEHCDVAVTDVDVLVVTLEGCLASVGGLCLGNLEVVDHQRLSGAGYCFSASAPPFVSAVASAALKVLQAEPKLLVSLRQNSEALVRGVSVQCAKHLQVVSHAASPIVHATLTPEVAAKVIERATKAAAASSNSPPNGETAAAAPATLSADAQWAALAEALAAVCDQCVNVGHVALTSTKRMKGEVTGYHALAAQHGAALQVASSSSSSSLPPPTLRLAVRSTLDEKQLRAATTAIQQACAAVLG